MADARMALVDPTFRLYGGSNSDFPFRSPNLFSNVQIVPEKIIQFSVSPDGVRYYKVVWQDTWLPEHHLLPYATIIEEFWRKQNELVTRPSGLESSTTSPGQTLSTSHTTSSRKPEESFLSQLSSIPDVPPQKSNMWKSYIEDPCTLPFMQAPSSSKSDDKLIQKSHVKKPSYVNATTPAATVPAPAPPAPPPPSAPPVTSPCTIQSAPVISKAASAASTISSSYNTSTKINMLPSLHPQTTQSSNEMITLPFMGSHVDICEDNPAVEENPGDEQSHDALDNYIPAGYRRPNPNLPVENLELANIENTLASKEELLELAHTILGSFRKKRVRFPNGSSKLPQTCEFCLKTICNRKKLREHQFSVHFKNVGDFYCEICDKRFVYRRQFNAHLVTHSDKRRYVCKFCGLTCKRRSHLHKHVETHKKERNYRCDVCHKNFKVQAELKAHCLSEHKNQVMECNVCKHKLHTAYSVYIHSMRHSGIREFTCDQCGAMFKRKQHLREHMNVHRDKSEEFRCPACEKGFKTKWTWRKHVDSKHTGITSYKFQYVCEICDKDFAYKGRRDEHMKLHDNETEQDRHAREIQKKISSGNFSMEDLGQEIASKAEMVADAETGRTKFRCKLCKVREFRFFGALERHLKAHEDGQVSGKEAKKHKCEECGQLFARIGQLRSHMRKHEERAQDEESILPIHECAYCGKTYKYRSYMRLHIKKMHGPEAAAEAAAASKKASVGQKGATKRKAALKAKEKSQREYLRSLEISSDEDDSYDSEDEEDFTTSDDDSEGTDFNVKEVRTKNRRPSGTLRNAPVVRKPPRLSPRKRLVTTPTKRKKVEMAKSSSDEKQGVELVQAIDENVRVVVFVQDADENDGKLGSESSLSKVAVDVLAATNPVDGEANNAISSGQTTAVILEPVASSSVISSSDNLTTSSGMGQAQPICKVEENSGSLNLPSSNFTMYEATAGATPKTDLASRAGLVLPCDDIATPAAASSTHHAKETVALNVDVGLHGNTDDRSTACSLEDDHNTHLPLATTGLANSVAVSVPPQSSASLSLPTGVPASEE